MSVIDRHENRVPSKPAVDRLALRNLMMVKLYADGWRVKEIAAYFRVHRRTVLRGIKSVDPEKGQRVLSLS